MGEEKFKLKVVPKEKLLQIKECIDFLVKNNFELEFSKENLIKLKNCMNELNYLGRNLFPDNNAYIRLESPDGTRLSRLN